MNIDLERSLDQLARSVGDDVAAERLGGQVHHMVARIRRRRAARRTTTGVVGVGAAAAVAFGGVQLVDRLDGSPQTVGPAVWDPGTWGCGPAPVIAQATGERVLNVSHDPSAAGDGVLRVGVTVGTADPTGLAFDTDPTVVLARDGVVVSRPGVVTMVAESFPPQYTLELDLGSCAFDGAALPDGGYEVLVSQTVGTPDGPVELFSATPLVIGQGDPVPDPTDAVPDPDQPTGPDDPTSSPQDPSGAGSAAEQIDAWLAAPVANPGLVMPRCGAEAALDDGMPALELDLLVDPGALTEPGGSTLPDAVLLKTTEGRYAIGNASPLARVVLMVDGVVVGYQFLDTEDLVDVDLASGETQPFPLRTTTALCGTGEGGQGEALPLPPGEYTAIATLDLVVKEIGGPGEEPDGTTYPFTAVSEPVTVQIG